jgi:hypothetical protein
MRMKTANFFILIALVFGAFSLPFSALAQQTTFELKWKRGTVYLTSGDTVSGPVSLTLPGDVVSVKMPNGQLSAFATVNVTGFNVHEEKDDYNFRAKYGPLEFSRRYQTYLWNHNKDFSNFLSPAFFVVVQPGPYTLLMRETKITVPISRGSFYNQSSVRTERIIQHFYLAKPDKQIIPLRSPRKDLQNLFPKLKDAMMKFAKSNKLDFDDPIELARIVEYCNRSL